MNYNEECSIILEQQYSFNNEWIQLTVFLNNNNFLWFRDSCNFSIDSIQMSYCEWIKKMNEFKKRCFELNVRIIHWWSNHNDGWPNRFVFKQTKKNTEIFFRVHAVCANEAKPKIGKKWSNRIELKLLYPHHQPTTIISSIDINLTNILCLCFRHYR